MDIYLMVEDFISDIGIIQFVMLSTIIGIMIGSFSNVVSHRLPIMMIEEFKEACEIELQGEAKEKEVFNISKPRSCCPQCKEKIAWHDNIPILSWLLLMGRCRHCKSKISIKYPLIEVLSGVFTGVSTYLLFPDPIAIIFSLLFISAMTLLMIDIKHMLLPDVFTISILWAGLLLSVLGVNDITPSESIIGAFFGYALLWSVSRIVLLWKGVESLGFGDIKYISAIGAWVGAVTLLHMISIICFIAILMFIALYFIDKILGDNNKAYNEYKKVEENTKKDAGMAEAYKDRRALPLGPSISIVFIGWMILNIIN